MSRRLIVRAGRETREFVLVGTIVVGRDPSCDISDAGDPLLSRRHAEFSNANEAMVRDLGSRNGILVNGVKTPQAVLRAGDVAGRPAAVKFVDELGLLHDVPGAQQPATAPASDATNAATVVLDHPTFPPLDRRDEEAAVMNTALPEKIDATRSSSASGRAAWACSIARSTCSIAKSRSR